MDQLDSRVLEIIAAIVEAVLDSSSYPVDVRDQYVAAFRDGGAVVEVVGLEEDEPAILVSLDGHPVVAVPLRPFVADLEALEP